MNKVTTLLPVLMLVASGCGVKKSYVDQQIATAEARQNARIQEVSERAEFTAEEVKRLNQLHTELSERTDKAINQAAGFENYQVLWTGEVFFQFDSHELTETAQGVLAEAGRTLEQHPKAIVEVIGYTDRTGSKDYNLQLGQRRSDAAKRFLADRFGVMLYRMFDMSYGEERQIEGSDTRGGGERNRRVELKVWGPPTGTTDTRTNEIG